MLRKIFFITAITAMVFVQGCTRLDENFQGDLTQDQVAGNSANVSGLLQGVYNSMDGLFSDQTRVFPLQEITTDAAIAPTRGADWDDNGSWRALHQHKWNSGNTHLKDCFNGLNGIIYASTDLLRYNPTKQQQAEARMLRAWCMYLLLDMFNQVPYRDPGESPIKPSRVMIGKQALDYIVGELDTIQPDLPDGPPYIANKYAAKFLLMKCYLNKSVYLNRGNPSFDIADMNKVIILADEIINSAHFGFSKDYFDNFSPDNTLTGRENIFTQLNEAGTTPNNALASTWGAVFHYNQSPVGGWNGFATLSEFYNRFESADKRSGEVYATAGSAPNTGNRINIGFLVGQQYNLFTDSPLTYGGAGTPLVYTPEVKNTETGSNLEVTGIRPIKYAPDYNNFFSPGNDFVYYRLSDVLLMKAEAIWRGGTGTNSGPYGNTAEKIVNYIRTNSTRGATPLTAINQDNLLDERGRELWWEGWRRQDMIRFKKFLDPFQEKAYQSDPKYLLFPIPDEQLAVNPYLQQNPGY